MRQDRRYVMLILSITSYRIGLSVATSCCAKCNSYSMFLRLHWDLEDNQQLKYLCNAAIRILYFTISENNSLADI
jgi:hypothetical protein